VTWTAGGSQTVSWNVAGTASAPISTPSVDIRLSTDGGLTFPVVLAAGTPNDGTQIVTVPNNPTSTARVRVSAVGNVFFDISDANFTIQAQVPQASLSPAALVVDSPGNGVLQPGETAVVAPAWLNGGTAALVNGVGALSNLTGPAGPTYTITDAAAGYGTINVNATGSCTATGNCYSVSIAGARPAVHWDATVAEAVTPGNFTKTWTLHVGDSFTDVPPGNSFYRFIEIMLHRGLTGGCTGSTFCPGGSTSREQMSVFVLRSKDPALNPPACGTPVFPDVPASSPYCRWIEELARRGVVTGCGGGNFCPTAPVSREQMAVFVLRTLDPALNPPACTAGSEMFADVPASSPFCKWIEELARRGVVTGCGNGNYCPAADVTREQMAVFLVATFGLTLYGP
jgi:hypothetical protein